MEWFRWYHGACCDAKWPIVARKAGVTVGVVVSVWVALLEHASQDDERGSVARFDCETFDALYGYEDGVCERVITALGEKGLIRDNRIVAWETRQPVREREDDTAAERKRRERERKRQEQQELSPDAPPRHAAVTPCHAAVTPPDKIREEKKEKTQTGSLRSPVSPEPRAAHSGKASAPEPESAVCEPSAVGQPSPQASPPPEAVPDVLETVIALPLNTGEEHPVTGGEVETWQDLYPAVDVMQELRNMRGWLLGNKTRRKTRHGIGRFIQSWLAKEQNRGGRRGVTPERIGISGQGGPRDRPAATTVAQQQVQHRDTIARMLIAYREGNDARQERDAAEYSGPVGPALSAGGLHAGAVACLG